MHKYFSRLGSQRFLSEALLVILLSLTVNGCILPIPMPEHNILIGRGEIDETDRAFLQVGTTSREDVLLRFGEPDATLCNERVLAYYWTVARGYTVVGAPGYAAASTWRTQRIFMLEFDDRVKLKRFEELKIKSDLTSFDAYLAIRYIENWKPSDCPEPKYR